MTTEQRLTYYAMAKGYKVKTVDLKTMKKLVPKAIACWHKNTIYISEHISKRMRPYFLAHEIGHILDAEERYKQVGRKRFREEYKRYNRCQKAMAQGLRPHASLLLTARFLEARADSMGCGLLFHLGVKFSVEVYKKMSAENLANYVKQDGLTKTTSTKR